MICFIFTDITRQRSLCPGDVCGGADYLAVYRCCSDDRWNDFYQILVIPLEMSYYILADKPELKSTEAMKESLEMMHGNFGRYLMLKKALSH